MEPSLFRYILTHSRNGQIALMILSLLSLPVVYITLELPKKIINLLEGENIPEGLINFDLGYGLAVDIGADFDQLDFLLVFSFSFLFAVLVAGGMKYVLNVYRGVLGERVLRRFRFELYERILRFPLPHFKRVSQGELIPTITAETEPLGGFIGESFTLPVYQGGLLFTFLLFIFQQDPWLGTAAIALYPFQLYVIPKLQKKVNLLAKDRVRTVRNLQGRIGETIAGINEVHANDTSHYERAHISHKLGRIYQIRLSIYRRKFFIKFLNNFIAQLTPFFFYSIGGYFVLRGDLSIGAMVAVLVAYKDLAGPWKELLRFYQQKEDIKVKYTQVIEQFNPQDLIDKTIIDGEAADVSLPATDLKANSISYTEDGLYFSINSASFRIPPGQSVAVVGLSNSGKDELARLVSRLINPTTGAIAIGNQRLSDMPEALTGRRMGYVGQNTHLFTGSIFYNLLYPLKHRPVSTADAIDSKQREVDVLMSKLSGNSIHSIQDSWVDYASIGVDSEKTFNQRLRELLNTVELDDDIYQFGLQSQVDQSSNLDLAQRIMKARDQLREKMRDGEYARLVEPFDQDAYNTNMSVAENLLFGTIYDDSIDSEHLAENKTIRDVLEETDLTEEFVNAGKQIAQIMLDLFSDVEPDSELFEQFSFISADDLPDFQQLLVRTRDANTESISEDDRIRLLSLPFKLIITRHRLGLINEDAQQKILKARVKIRDAAETNHLGVEFFNETQFNPRISIQDNILFGKLVYGQANAQLKINELIANVVSDLALRNDIIDAGLAFEVGVGGARLSASQRQKLGLARALVKAPDILIVNEAMAGLDTSVERRLIERVREQMKSGSVFWVLARSKLAENFDSVIVLERGKLVAEGSFNEISKDNAHLQQLLENE